MAAIVFTATYNDLSLDAEIHVRMQPHLNACLCLEELKDQELEEGGTRVLGWRGEVLTMGLIMSLCSLRG